MIGSMYAIQIYAAARLRGRRCRSRIWRSSASASATALIVLDIGPVRKTPPSWRTKRRDFVSAARRLVHNSR